MYICTEKIRCTNSKEMAPLLLTSNIDCKFCILILTPRHHGKTRTEMHLNQVMLLSVGKLFSNHLYEPLKNKKQSSVDFDIKYVL